MVDDRRSRRTVEAQLARQDARTVRRTLRVTHGTSEPFERAVDAAQRGHQAGFDYLHRELFTRLHNYARVRQEPDPADLASEVLLKAFTRIGQFRGNEPQFKAWVFRIALNTVVDNARRRAVRPVETLVDLTPLKRSTDDPEKGALANLALDGLLAELDVLTNDQRNVVILRIVADLTVPAIAELLEKSPEAVKALQRRAFSVLSKQLSTDRRITSLVK